MLQTLRPEMTYHGGEAASNGEIQQTLNIFHWIDVLKRRFFYFLSIFGLVSISGLYAVALLRPLYLSEGKILLQSQEIAPDLITPVVTATASERAQLIQHRIMTRENLLLIASKFGLFPRMSDSTAVADLMKKRTQIKPLSVEVDGQLRPNSRAVAFTVGFEHENAELAVRVANEFITMIVSGDESSRTSRTTEMVKLLTSQAKDIETQIESTQTRIGEIARRPRESAEVPDEQKSQLVALAALKTELTQKLAVYSDAHPAVIALKKRIASTERNLSQISRSPTRAQSDPEDNIEALTAQRQALEKQLADANNKLASARLREKLDLEQQERMQVVETPSLPDKPVKSKKILIAGFVLVAGAVLGLAAAIGPELLNGSIHARYQLAGIVDSSLVVSIPYIATRADAVRTKVRTFFAIVSVLIVMTALLGLTASIVLNWPIDAFSFDKAPLVSH